MGFSDDYGYDKQIDVATRKSIQKTFPMGIVMKWGTNNPVTLHSADSEIFRSVYSLITETLSVKVALNRSVKERICNTVSQRNECPVCVAAHTMMETVASKVEQKERGGDGDVQQLALVVQYTESVLDALEEHRKGGTKEIEASPLDEATRAEIALVVMLFDHMNRVVSALMGEQMSTAMMGVPRAVAKCMEKNNVVIMMSRWMSGVLASPFQQKDKPGMTRNMLFRDDDDSIISCRVNSLPDHLSGLRLAGAERANAVGRILEWITAYETKLFEEKEFLSKGIVDLLDRAVREKARDEDSKHPGKVLKWATSYEEEELESELSRLYVPDAGRSVVLLLLLLSLAPLTIYESPYWDDAVDKLNDSPNKARTLLIWWSLRTTLRDAAGLDSNGNADTNIIKKNSSIKRIETEVISSDDEPKLEC